MSQNESSKGFMIGYQIARGMTPGELSKTMRQIPGTYRKLAGYKRQMSDLLSRQATIMDRVADMLVIVSEHYETHVPMPAEEQEKYTAATRAMFDIASEIDVLHNAIKQVEDEQFRELGLNADAIRAAARDTIPCAPVAPNGKRGEA